MPKVRTKKVKIKMSYDDSFLWNGSPEGLRNEPTLTSPTSGVYGVIDFGFFVCFKLAIFLLSLILFLYRICSSCLFLLCSVYGFYTGPLCFDTDGATLL